LTKLVAALTASLILLALVASGAAAQQQEPRLGVVDMAKVLDGYKEFKSSDAEYKAFLTERQQQLQERMSVRMLGDDEMKEYQNLKSVTAPTAEQKQRLEQLRAVAETREKELTDLQSVASPTDEQKKRMADLAAVADKSTKEIEDLQKRLSDEINQRNKELSEKLNSRIESALAAVAKDKRVDFILAKDAVLYGGRDLTDDVLAKLNAGAS
jgi:Skp family chaperone for outer membrane proteins